MKTRTQAIMELNKEILLTARVAAQIAYEQSVEENQDDLLRAANASAIAFAKIYVHTVKVDPLTGEKF